MAKPKKDQSATRAEDCPTAWFAVLEEARNRNDQRGIDRAERELKRLGVRDRSIRSRRDDCPSQPPPRHRGARGHLPG